MDLMPEQALNSSADLGPQDLDDEVLEDAYDEMEEPAQTCYHCFQAESEQAELCPVCGDSYLPPALRQPH